MPEVPKLAKLLLDMPATNARAVLFCNQLPQLGIGSAAILNFMYFAERPINPIWLQ